LLLRRDMGLSGEVVAVHPAEERCVSCAASTCSAPPEHSAQQEGGSSRKEMTIHLSHLIALADPKVRQADALRLQTVRQGRYRKLVAGCQRSGSRVSMALKRKTRATRPTRPTRAAKVDSPYRRPRREGSGREAKLPANKQPSPARRAARARRARHAAASYPVATRSSARPDRAVSLYQRIRMQSAPARKGSSAHGHRRKPWRPQKRSSHARRCDCRRSRPAARPHQKPQIDRDLQLRAAMAIGARSLSMARLY